MSSANNTLSLSRSLTDTLNFVANRYVNQLPLILTIFGVIGLIGNAFTFLQPALRWNTFCIYSLVESLVDVLNLFINLLPNYIEATNGNLVSAISVRVACRCKMFALSFLPQLSMNLLILSLIDRFACTCTLTSSIRHLRQLKMVPWLIGMTIIVTCPISIYTLTLYDIVPGIGCSSTKPLLNSILYIATQGVMTPMVMVFFVILTYRNIKRSRRRVGVVITGNQGRPRAQFIGMIFVQIFVTSIFVWQWIGMYFYFLITGTNARSAEEWAITYFVLSLTNNLYYVINIKSFYPATLTSRLFRTTLKTALAKLFFRCLGLR